MPSAAVRAGEPAATGLPAASESAVRPGVPCGAYWIAGWSFGPIVTKGERACRSTVEKLVPLPAVAAWAGQPPTVHSSGETVPETGSENVTRTCDASIVIARIVGATPSMENGGEVSAPALPARSVAVTRIRARSVWIPDGGVQSYEP